MADRQRILAGTAATLSWQAVDQDGEPSDPGVTTVIVTGSDGSTVLASTLATASGDLRTVNIPAQECDILTAVWSGATASGTTYVDVVGGVYFTTARLRAAHPEVSIVADYEAAKVIEKRLVTETKFEQSTGTAFVPRFQVIPVHDSIARQQLVRSVRWLQLKDGTFVTDPAAIALRCRISTSGVVCSVPTVAVGAVVGFDTPPADVAEAAMLYTKHQLTAKASQVDMRVLALNTPDGSMMRFATPGTAKWVTGIPEIDEVLIRYAARKLPRSIRTDQSPDWVYPTYIDTSFDPAWWER